MHPIKHFMTITHHKNLVRKNCFEVGLYKQGLLHDMSKYSPTEFLVGAKYYQGNRSPNNAEREELGYSSAWLHHKGRNRHHYEYWIDYSSRVPGGMIPVPMPDRYIVEMLMDRIAACQVYEKDKFTWQSPLNYYKLGRDPAPMHEYTREMLEKLLTMLANEGREKTFVYIKREILKNKRQKQDMHGIAGGE